MKYYCLVMTENYIKRHFSAIKEYANVIENRIDDSWYTMEMVLEDNAYYHEMCKKHGCNCILIDGEYQVDVDMMGGLIMKIKVQYTTVIVKNLEESVQFYRDCLGFTEGYHCDLPNGGSITIMQSQDGACVELIENQQFDVGMYSIGTDVDNLDEALEVLDAKGVKPISPVVTTTVGRMTFVQDPNGIRICLIEHFEEYKKKYMK